MELNLTEKVYLISGGAKGIGAAITNLIAEEGGIPVVVGRSKDEANEMIKKLTQKKKEAYSIVKELGSPQSCREAVEETIQKYGRLDGLINNAGANDSVGLEHGTPENYLASLEKNLHHYFYLAHYALPYLKTSQGTIINISSKCGVTGQGRTSGYTASKGAQLALTRDWAIELLPYKIRVNAVIPAEVMTPLYEKWLSSFSDPEIKLKNITKNIPFENRMTTPEEIANMVVFLLSSRASHITGQHVFVDGGYTHLDRAL
jgi:L-fucose dehydrogenase